MEELVEVKARWRDIGINLGLSPGTLESIKSDGSDVSERYCKMLQEWLQNSTNRNWKTLAEAVGSTLVGCKSLKDSILRKYCT